ncbi:hypothetical protein GCM10010924_49530 [Rhizobium wenxiniae]|uniref:AEC family transporter n=1 Tax=Rhizobium wenxiniae TaxID=1737357 RepID=A0A7W9YB45_9HYPH|nr:AEC family transporter [Rhizobium wenxiniae]MBB6165315.1 hypothetical protein [Rhizobium wenxiniae]GGG14446.1 hypothetical protein GCM10010924_49530 [Rhizobium wenxiniae]
MIAAFLIVIPIFALIFAGWGAGRAEILGPNASLEINKFVVWLAVPALLFDVISSARPQDLAQSGFIGAFGVSTIIIFVMATLVATKVRGNLADGAIDGLNGAYSNIGFVGLPLLIMVLGRTSVIFTTLALLITMCLVFAAAIVLAELSINARGSNARQIAGKVFRTLIRNPILLSSLAALPFPFLGLSLPGPIKTFLELLSAAASPCALVALGLFLSQPRPSRGLDMPFIGFLVLTKLAIHPLLAWAVSTFVFELRAPETVAVTLLAALPAGTGSFMVAGFYARDATVTTYVIIVSTVVSILTLAILISGLPVSL